jgi:hypothetical protein
MPDALPFRDPYPDGPVSVARLIYHDTLVLLRLKKAPRLRGTREAHFILGTDYAVSYETGDGTRMRLAVPRGMVTDLASVPPVFRSLVSRTGPWVEAAVVHDFLTIAWRAMDGVGSAERRRFADEMMLAGMAAAGVDRARRGLIYAGIRAAAVVGYPQRQRPRPWSDFSVDLAAPDIVAQLPPGLRAGDATRPA